jgi:starvation-inducible outer membrane lipoprotein
MKAIWRSIVAITLALALPGCAASPESIKPASINPKEYAYLDCAQLAAFKITLINAYNKAADSENNARNMDAATLLTLGVPVGSMTHENVPYQSWDLKGRIIAVQNLQARYNCNAQQTIVVAHKN